MKISKISKLPPAIRREIEERLYANGFGDYKAIEDGLRKRGWHIGKSSIHRWGIKLKQIQLTADIEAAKARAKRRARKAGL